MWIQSTWQVVLGGVTLLAFADSTDGEPAIGEWSQRVQTVEALRSAFIGNIGRGNVRMALSFRRVKFFTGGTADSLARAFLLSHTVALPLAAGDCVVTLQGGSPVYTLKSAVVTGYRPRVQNNKFLCDYTILGGQLTT